MDSLISFLEGKKTYIACFGTILWALIGWLAGLLDPEIAQQMITTALIGAGLRAAKK